MSRSYKKFPVVTDNGSARKIFKRQANKAVRRYNKILSSGRSFKKLYCSYNICDYKNYCSLQTYIKDYKDADDRWWFYLYHEKFPNLTDEELAIEWYKKYKTK